VINAELNIMKLKKKEFLKTETYMFHYCLYRKISNKISNLSNGKFKGDSVSQRERKN